jgi:hypothetical protein
MVFPFSAAADAVRVRVSTRKRNMLYSVYNLAIFQGPFLILTLLLACLNRVRIVMTSSFVIPTFLKDAPPGS